MKVFSERGIMEKKGVGDGVFLRPHQHVVFQDVRHARAVFGHGGKGHAEHEVVVLAGDVGVPGAVFVAQQHELARHLGQGFDALDGVTAQCLSHTGERRFDGSHGPKNSAGRKHPAA